MNTEGFFEEGEKSKNLLLQALQFLTFQQRLQREADKIFRANPRGRGEFIYGRGFEWIKSAWIFVLV